MEFKIPELLQSTNLTIRPLKESDFDNLFRAASDPEIWKLHPIPERYQLAVFKEYFKTIFAFGGAMVVLDRRSQDIIGSSTFYNIKPETKELEIGYTFLQKKYWGGDFNWEMKSLMMDHAFQWAKQILFYVGPNNIRSQKAMLKIGGILRGPETRPAADGQMRTNLVYLIDKANYQEKKANRETNFYK